MECKIDCSKCPAGQGACCGVFPIEREIIEKNKDKFQIKDFKTIDTGGEKICLAPEDFKCVFWNRETKLCVIYDDRPKICRLFGTKEAEQLEEGDRIACAFFKPNGNPRSKARQAQLERLQDKMAKQILNYGKNIRVQEVPKMAERKILAGSTKQVSRKRMQ